MPLVPRPDEGASSPRDRGDVASTGVPLRRAPRGTATCAVLAVLAAAACVAPGAHTVAPPPPRDDGTTWIAVDGAWLRARVAGRESDKPAVVLLHGYGSRLEAWREVQPALAADRLVVAIDQRGFGLSERPADGYGPEAHARDVVAVMDALGVHRAVVVGHSYGAGVALRAALRFPDRVAGVGLVSAFALEEQIPTSFRWAQVPVVGEALFGGFYREVPGEKYLLAFHDRERWVSARALEEMKTLMAIEGSTYAALATVRGMSYADVEDDYRTIAVPTTLVFGQDDRIVPATTGRRFAGVFDRARYVELPACGHMPSWERPAATTAALAQLLADVDAARGEGAPPTSAPARSAPSDDGADDASPGAAGGAT